MQKSYGRGTEHLKQEKQNHHIVNVWLHLTKVKIRSAITSACLFLLLSNCEVKYCVIFSGISVCFKKKKDNYVKTTGSSALS